ncbi:MAG: hypothetical protein IKW03_09900 [Clostridia bacterium]|nr:hypothetical protein [Clostridia bacterium]
MKCKECKENISSKVKYCPECGALVNDIKYNVLDYSRYSPQLQQEIQKNKAYTPEYDEETGRPAVFNPDYNRNRKSAKINLKAPAIIIFVVIFLFVGLSFALNIIDEFDFSDIEFEDAFELVPEFNIDSAEFVADEYVNNIMDSDCMQDSELFRTHSLIDWDLVFKDLANIKTESETGVTEITDDEFFNFAEEPLRNAFDVINSKFTDDFTPFFFYSELRGRYLVTASERQNYIDILSEDFKAAGLNVYDYFDPSQLTDIYRCEYYVTAEDEDCTETQDYGMINVIVAEFYGEYYILYDSAYINTLLVSMK